MTHLPHLAGRTFTASAFCQARARLPLAVFQALVRRLATAMRPLTQEDQSRWRGHRLILVDGSGFSMPDTPPLQAHFGQSKRARPGCGFPVAHLLAVIDATTGLLLEAFAAPLHSSDLGLVRRVHPALEPGDVLIGDRGFCSYWHLARVRAFGLQAVFRLHQKQIVDFTPGRPHALPERPAPRGMPRSRWWHAHSLTDQVVEWFRPARRPAWMDAAEYARCPESLVVRELRYRISTPGFRTREVTLVTTLVDAAA
jgi:hypothetical protein